MSIYLSEIERLPNYLWGSKEKTIPKVTEKGFTLYVHRVQNIWHILYWMYTHEEYCKTGFYMAEYCMHVLMRKLSDLGEAEYHFLLKQLLPVAKHPTYVNSSTTNCHHTSGLFSDLIVSGFKESMLSPFVLNMLRRLSNMKESEKHLSEVLMTEGQVRDNSINTMNGFDIFWEIIRRIQNTVFNIPSILLDKCHTKFANYLVDNFDKMQNSRSEVYNKCKEIYYDSNWFEMDYNDVFSLFTLYIKQHESQLPPAEVVKSWIKTKYDARKTWFAQLKFLLNSLEPVIVEKYLSEILKSK